MQLSKIAARFFMLLRFRLGIIVWLILAVLCSSPAANAQSSANGLPPFNSFAGGGLDTINLNNLNVGIKIPLYDRKGRGVDFGLGATYNSVQWTSSAGLGHWFLPQPGLSFWRVAAGHTHAVTWTTRQVNCGFEFPDDLMTYNLYGDVAVTDSEGTSHSFEQVQFSDQNYQCFGENYPGGASAYANDGSGLQLEIDMDGYGTLTSSVVTEKDGIASYNNFSTDPNSYIIDGNGNLITIAGGTGVFSATDTQGQVALSSQPTNPTTGATVYTYPTATGDCFFHD